MPDVLSSATVPNTPTSPTKPLLAPCQLASPLPSVKYKQVIGKVAKVDAANGDGLCRQRRQRKQVGCAHQRKAGPIGRSPSDRTGAQRPGADRTEDNAPGATRTGSGLENQRRRLRALSDRLSGPGADRTEDSGSGVRDCEGARPAMGRQATLKRPYTSRCGDSSIAAGSREAKWQRGLCCPPAVGGSAFERGKSGIGADTTGWPTVRPGPPARRVDGSKPDNCVATRRVEAVRRLIGVGRRSLITGSWLLRVWFARPHRGPSHKIVQLQLEVGSSARWASAPSAKSALVASLPRQRGRGRSR